MISAAHHASQCAACGKDGDGLKACTACKLVRYCNVACQKAHRSLHKKECKRRAAEIFDEALFKDPPPREDCPICFIPLPRAEDTSYQVCCGKLVCSGCVYSMLETASTDGPPPPINCPFCRAPEATSDEKEIKRIKMRMKANDFGAFHHLACEYEHGNTGLSQDSEKALELWLRAAKLGSSMAHHSLSSVYYERDDVKKSTYHTELAAMGGVVEARYNLGHQESVAGNFNRAMKHFMIAARAGNKDSMNVIRDQGSLQERGLVTKEDYEKTLRAYEDSLAGMRSEQRDRFAKHSYEP